MASPNYIVNNELSAFTVAYNAVQFGGADATYKSLPPMYSLRGRFQYDESGRSVIATIYTLIVKCIFLESSEASMSANMATIRRRICQPGYQLTIRGLGLGFFTNADPLVDGVIVADVMNGPKPEDLQFNAIAGQLAWELTWTVQFSLCECSSLNLNPLAFLAFNFNTTWTNDFEGLCTRTISGHAMIAQNRSAASPATVAHVADEVRNSIVIVLPSGFQRVTNVWNETIDKARLNFTIVDEQLEGDVLPPGIVAGDGSCSFSAGDGSVAGSGMAQGMVSLSMSLKTAPNQPRNFAGQIFLAAALSKQVEMIASMAAQKITYDVDNAPAEMPAGLAIPVRISITNGKFSRARQTEASMTWIVTQSLNSILTASGVFTPVSPNDYSLWQASMAPLWGNRGFAQMSSQASEAVILDLCDNIVAKTIGANTLPANNPSDASLPSLTCPAIPDNGGWIYFDIDIRVLRKDNQTQHRKAVAFNPSKAASLSDPLLTNSITTGAESYTQSASDEHVTEYHGFPETLIGLTFAGARFKNKPYVPEIDTIAGLKAIPIDYDYGVPKLAFDAFGCPIWTNKGWRVYSVPGYVPSTKSVGSVVSFASGLDPTELLEL
jgi:hypothetical protein